MEKLSPKVKQLYSWLQQGNAIEQCTTAGRSIGMLSTSNNAPAGSLKSPLNTLIQYGLLNETEVYYYGVRWSRFTAKRAKSSEVKHG